MNISFTWTFIFMQSQAVFTWNVLDVNSIGLMEWEAGRETGYENDFACPIWLSRGFFFSDWEVQQDLHACENNLLSCNLNNNQWNKTYVSLGNTSNGIATAELTKNTRTIYKMNKPVPCIKKFITLRLNIPLRLLKTLGRCYILFSHWKLPVTRITTVLKIFSSTSKHSLLPLSRTDPPRAWGSHNNSSRRRATNLSWSCLIRKKKVSYYFNHSGS